MLKYNKNAIVFEAIVQNNSHRACLLPEQTSEILSRYGLPFAKTTSLGICKDFDSVCDTLYVNYQDISGSEIQN